MKKTIAIISLFLVCVGATAQTERVTIPHDTKITTTRDTKNLIQVPVRTPKDSVLLIFDTGAGMTCVTETVAEKLGIAVLEDSIEFGGAAGNRMVAHVGFADTLYFGDILYENVECIVMPDEQLTFPEHDYAANGAFGFPEMKLLPALKIYKNGMLEVIENPGKHKSNMKFTENNDIVVRTKDNLWLYLDTGSVKTDMSVNYYKNHAKYVQKTGVAATDTVHGVGNTADEYAVYHLTNFPIKIDKSTTIIPHVSVFSHSVDNDFVSGYDGNLGQDVFLQYDYMLLDFKNMYFALGNTEKKK